MCVVFFLLFVTFQIYFSLFSIWFSALESDHVHLSCYPMGLGAVTGNNEKVEEE